MLPAALFDQNKGNLATSRNRRWSRTMAQQSWRFDSTDSETSHKNLNRVTLTLKQSRQRWRKSREHFMISERGVVI